MLILQSATRIRTGVGGRRTLRFFVLFAQTGQRHSRTPTTGADRYLCISQACGLPEDKGFRELQDQCGLSRDLELVGFVGCVARAGQFLHAAEGIKTTIDRNNHPGHKTRAVRQQIQQRADQLFWITESPHGRVR